MNKLVCWALFDSETGDYMSTVHKYFEDKIDIHGVGMSHYGKNTDHYVNYNLADFSELFDGEGIGKKLLKLLPKPDIIVASPPCESWSHMTSINNGNIHWKRYASKLFPENKVFQLQDVDVQTGFIKNNGIKTFYCRVNGELCHQNTWEIIKTVKPKVFMVENPDNYSWEYIKKYVAGGIPEPMYMNKLVYSAYDPIKFSPKREIFGSNIKLKFGKIVERIAGMGGIVVDYVEVPQDAHLADNQSERIKCGDNGIFKGVPLNDEEKMLSSYVRMMYDKFPTDGKFIYSKDDNKLIICQSNASELQILQATTTGLSNVPELVINPLGEWTGGVNVDSGATNRKLGSDMGRAVTGGGLHGKDLSKADVSVNIYAHILAQEREEEVNLLCAIGDEYVDGVPYSEIVEVAEAFVKGLGGFEKLAEWGLF